MRIKRRKPYKNILTAIMLSCCILTVGIRAYGSYINESLKKDITGVTLMLEELLDAEYKKKEREVIDLVKSKGYDYTLTMQSFYDNGNPYKDVDYIKLISQYATIKEYCLDNNIPIGTGISELPFLKMEIEEKSYEVTIPYLYPTYTLSTDGYYYLTGNSVITEQTEVTTYEQVLDDPYKYIETGTTIVEPSYKTVVYADIDLSFIDDKEIYRTFNVNAEDVQLIYNNRHNAIDKTVNNTVLQQNVFINTRQIFDNCSELSVEQADILISNAPADVQDILKTGISLVGEVPYEWGGKADSAGYDINWWTYNSNGQQKGLDCSGFVQWVYMTSGYPKPVTDKLLSTETIRLNLKDITKEELKPGDVGLLNQGEGTNHTGIYLGDGYWIHCSSAKKTVVIEKYAFNFYKTVENSDSIVDNEVPKLYYNQYNTKKYTKGAENTTENVILLAQLMEHEAADQGFNGWVGVGEVVMNRISCDKFPDTIEDVIYQPGQFSKSEEIATIIPRDEVVQVATDIINGSLRYFNNKDVLYFKNPIITDGIEPTEKADWNGLKYYGYINDHAYYTDV